MFPYRKYNIVKIYVTLLLNIKKCPTHTQYFVNEPINTSPRTYLRRFYETLIHTGCCLLTRLKSNILWQHPNDLTCKRYIPATEIKLSNDAMSLTTYNSCKWIGSRKKMTEKDRILHFKNLTDVHFARLTSLKSC